jgi:succinyl-CoA synthetase beta subunit
MARIYEYQAKELLQKKDIQVPIGDVAATSQEVEKISRKIGRQVVIKAQIWATGRFDAGGIKFADDAEQASKLADEMIGKQIKGLNVRNVLVEEVLNVDHEYYAGFVVDSSVGVRAPVFVFSTEGGTGIEEVAERNPERVFTYTIDQFIGFPPEEVAKAIKGAALAADVEKKMVALICDLFRFFKENDATNVEVNPVVLTKEGRLYAADAHVTLDDNAVFRHPEFGIKVPREMDRAPTELEQLAWDYIEEGDYRGTGYFAQMVTEFDDNEQYIGFHGIGGGGSMLGAAALINRGMKIANYTDTSGDPPASKIYKVIKAIFSQPISAYVVTGACLANQEQWYHAFAMVKALREELAERPGFPVVILLAGNKEAETMEILKNGLGDLDLRLELYGRDYIYNSDYIAERAQVLMDEYLN